jgi:hypothetical protein
MTPNTIYTAIRATNTPLNTLLVRFGQDKTPYANATGRYVFEFKNLNLTHQTREI